MDISSLLEVEVREGKPSELRNNGEIAAYKNIPDFSIRGIASVRFRKLHCTACDIHIGSAPAAAHNMHEHPVLHVLLCTACRNFYGDGTFEQGDDATDMFCRWCANGGNLYCCSYCSNTFCYNCIKRNFDAVVRKKIEKDEKWKCFVCNPADLYSARAVCWALLQHVQTVTRILQSDRKMSPKEIEAKMNLDESQCCPHRNKRKRSETVTDDEEHDDTYTVSKKKRRKLPNSKRKRRSIKLEDQDGTSDSASLEAMSNESSRERLAIRGLDDSAETRSENRTENRRRSDNRLDKEASADESSSTVKETNRRAPPESTSLAKFSVNEDAIAATLLECDQTMVEGAESLTFGNVATDGTANFEQSRNIAISAVPMVQLMKRPTPPRGPLIRGGKTHRLIRGVTGTPVLVRKIAPANANVAANVSSIVQSLPMVTIPALNHMQTGNRVSVIQTAALNHQDTQKSPTPTIRAIRPRPLAPKSLSTVSTVSNSTSRANASPSIIEIDSDSDDPVVLLTPSANSTVAPNERRNSEVDERPSELSTFTCPVRNDDGLMTILAMTNNGASQNEFTERANANDKTFAQTIRQPISSIETALDTLKNKIRKIMQSTMSHSPGKELNAARAKTRAVNRTIKRTVAELNSFNDDLLRAYRNYKREHTKETVGRTDSIVLDPKQKSRLMIPLEMLCTRESEPEWDEAFSDEDPNAENSQHFPPAEIVPFRRRVNRAIEAKPETKSKSVQAYDVRSRDYETSIGYALLLKADYDTKRERDVLRPVMVPDEHFGKYEEQFINYLQHIEDHGIETEESKESTPCNSVSVNELIEADITAMTADIDRRPSKGYDITKEQMYDENVEILEEHVEILTTKMATSEESNCSVSPENSEDERTTSTTIATASPGTKESSSTDKEKTVEKNLNKVTNATEHKVSPISQATPISSNAETSMNIDSVRTDQVKTKKDGGRVADKEIVSAVRALIDNDTTGQAGTTDILNSRKPVESDDECTIID